MASTNKTTKATPVFTHEGAKAAFTNDEQKLRRSVMSCLLWENEFYEYGKTIANRIAELIPKVKPEKVAQIALEARNQMKLRHIPLFITREMARSEKHKAFVSDTLFNVIQRADELTEFMAIYWKDKKQPLSSQVKKGLGRAFQKFSEFDLAKYNRQNAVKLRDVLFLSHAKPLNKEQESVWKKLINDELTTPDTWEVALSSGADKKATWERLLSENKLGALALLRNLRNMKGVGVNEKLIFNALVNVNTSRVLPFRFIAAAQYAPQWESKIEPVMLKAVANKPKLGGKTVLLVDVSGSMNDRLSNKSDLLRLDVANGLAILARELSNDIEIYTFSERLVQVPDRRGFALRDCINGSQYHYGTYLGRAIQEIEANTDYDRLIVITDEQSRDRPPTIKGKGYVINVASYQNGIGYGGSWTHIDGWSEAVLDYIQLTEELALEIA